MVERQNIATSAKFGGFSLARYVRPRNLSAAFLALLRIDEFLEIAAYMLLDVPSPYLVGIAKGERSGIA